VRIFCPALLSGKYFPTKCARRSVRGGQNASPPITWTEVPAGVRSFALSIIDRNPAANNWVHWLVANIPPTVREIAEHVSTIRDKMPPGAIEFRNSFGDIGYGGPQPPRGTGPHVYEITVYALTLESVSLGPFATIEEFLTHIRQHLLTSASTPGSFEQ
jgi:Raf kinase inhibitor-like YbhB/YbcL family protein